VWGGGGGATSSNHINKEEDGVPFGMGRDCDCVTEQVILGLTVARPKGGTDSK
jgi:hypothetical protein